MSATFSVLPPLAALLWRCFPPCRRAYFLLLCQKKVAKEKATPGSAVGYAHSLPLLGRAGVLPELAYGSNKASRLPPHRLRCSAPPKGYGRASQLHRPFASFPRRRESRAVGTAYSAFLDSRLRGNDGGGRVLRCTAPESKKPIFAPFSPARFSSPRGRRRATQGGTDKGRGLFEARRAEFRSALNDAQHREEVLLGCPRPDRVAQGTGRSPAPTPGRLLFAYFFLAKQEKVMSRVRRENQHQIRSKTTKA